MNNILLTNWAGLTGYDWTGLIMTLTIAALMLIVYVWVWRPANRDKFEQHRDFVLKGGSKESKHHG